MTEEKDIAKGMEDVAKVRVCKHNWIEGDNKDKAAYRCTRCGAWRFVR